MRTSYLWNSLHEKELEFEINCYLMMQTLNVRGERGGDYVLSHFDTAITRYRLIPEVVDVNCSRFYRQRLVAFALEIVSQLSLADPLVNDMPFGGFSAHIEEQMFGVCRNFPVQFSTSVWCRFCQYQWKFDECCPKSGVILPLLAVDGAGTHMGLK